MIYFDNAATTLHKPQEVIEAVIKAMSSMGNAGRGNTSASMEATHTVFDTRENLAKFFNIKDSSRIAFTCNSTEALNIAIKGIFKNGDNIITTMLEHNSVLRPLYEMEEKGVELSFVKADKLGNISYEKMESFIKNNTKAIICTHGSNLTGNLIDIKRVGEICKKYNLLFIVDASQTAGVFPIDVEDMNIDILCFTGHKSLLGPQGTGGIFVREGVEIKPLKSGGTGILTYSKSQPQIMPTYLEAGTLNGHGIAGLNAGIEFINKIGMNKIREKEDSLMWRFYNGVKNLSHIKIYGDFSKKERCPIVTLNIGEYDSGDIAEELLNLGISTRAGGHCAPLMHEALGTVEQGAVRFSFGYFNTEEEVDKVIEILKNIINEI
ncbi:aminotransferase class V-fold PLP-dependent enzyme [Fusobacterium mortiferum]|uniref:aminotransferase class V-fold PLP-dependent enzyme n=1 Tax=Fusobacterium mortiferum TaxID=850 RepID=UPI001F292AA9|nr:aminotransferase class V-fold PLP-dependent enzyme [Fusobacterium mortiferum]MCF2698644.1 aminotransferase class V-fold PLP-dependent enzyme [Fusobacterium mortiferum]